MEWAAESGGRLRVRDYGVLSIRLLGLGLQLGASRLRGMAAGHAVRPVDPSLLTPPRASVACDIAQQLCRDVSPPWLYNHSERTFIYAMALAHQGREPIRFDAELLYVASVLHDVGLTEAHEGAPMAAPCFAVRGAEVARHVANRAKWETARQRRVAEAVTMHLNVAVRASAHPEAYLVAAGSALDLTGLGRDRLPQDVIDYALSKHRHMGVKGEMTKADGPWNHERRVRPGCRIGLLSLGGVFRFLVGRGAPG
jgi:hypothetical protein